MKLGTLGTMLVALTVSAGLAAAGGGRQGSAEAAAAITPPTNLLAVQNGPTGVRFVWNRGEENIWFCVNTAESLFDLVVGGPTWQNHGCWTTQQGLDVFGLKCGTTYYWNVYAWNFTANATSSFSVIQTGDCSALIAPPTNLRAEALASGRVLLEWDPGAGNIWFCVNTARSFRDLAEGGATWRNHGCWSTSPLIVLSGLRCGTEYHWNVFAWNYWTNATSASSKFTTAACEEDES